MASHPDLLVPDTGARGSVLSRGDLLRLAERPDPWPFLDAAAPHLGANPHDHEVRAVCAARFAAIGFRTPATECFDALPNDWKDSPDLAPIRQAIERLPDDRVPFEARVACARLNLYTLRGRGVDLGAAFEAWRSTTPSYECLRTREGLTLRRARLDGGAFRWLALRDERADARSVPFDAPGAGGAAAVARPLVVEGVDPPWLLQRVWRETPAMPNGLRTRIDVVQRDAREFLDGISLADLRPIIEDDRVYWFVGEDASERLRADLASRFDALLPETRLGAPTLWTPASPDVGRVLEDAAAAQQREHERLIARVTGAHASKGVAHWAQRFGDAVEAGRSLRVLVPTCRYTTFVRHSADDLVRAFARAGHESRVLVEPDDCSRFSSVAYLRAIDEFAPDLVVLINYTRANMGVALPPVAPFVCWVQDVMPHLYDEKVGRAQTPLDFITGYVSPTLFDRHGYARQRAWPSMVAVSAEKFHPAPAPPDARREHECEILYAGRQSETPDEFHRRFVRESGPGSDVAKALGAIRERLEALATDPMRFRFGMEIGHAVRETIVEMFGTEPSPGVCEELINRYATPLVDRLIRHETLGWAATVAERNGWRFRLHGEGWERHPTLKAYARPALPHGEALRIAYQSASVCLHASANTGAHQRVIECAMSGGLPLVRLVHDDVLRSMLWGLDRARARAAPDGLHPTIGCPMWSVADHPEAMANVALQQRLGLPHRAIITMPGWAERMLDTGAVPPHHLHAAWLMGDLAETGFVDEAGLERLVRRAIERPRWRENISAGVRGRAMRELSTDAFVRTLLTNVRDGLATGPAPGGEPC